MKLTLKKTIASILCISMIPSMMTGCKKESTSYSHTDFAMGTVTNITLYGTSDDLEQTEQKIIDMEKKLEKQQLSWRLKSSQVSKINQKLEQNNGKTKVTGNLKNWLQQAIKISQDSYADGRNTVDPTIGALTKLWDFESSDPKVPDANKIKKAISGDLSENSQHVTVKDNGEILACDKNTKIDLGAYGKGIGTDEAIKMIKKDKEITGAMVALGGSIVVYGEKSDGSDWNVGIQDPNGKDGEVLGGIKVKSGTSISTSGDYEKTFTDKKTGKRYFHILDSKTGYSVKTDIRSCTIICDSGINADGLSTACFSLGVKKSQKLLKKYNAKAVFVDKNNKVYVSDGVEFTLTAKDYNIQHVAEVDKRVWKGQIKVWMEAIFLPYKAMKMQYPYLEKYPVFLPAAWIQRIFRTCFCRKGRAGEVLSGMKVEGNEVRKRQDLFGKLGLS